MNTNADTQTQTQPEAVTTLQTNVIGCVKWFNNRYGYGFIVATGEHSSYGDVFVHHSELQIKDETVYKFLMQGEYVQFSIVKTVNGKHEFQANHVTGVNSGKLMCENPVQRRPSRRFVEDEQEPVSEHDHSHEHLKREHKSTYRHAPRKNRENSTSATTPATSSQTDGFVFPKGRKPRSTSAPPQSTKPKPKPAPPTPYKNAVQNTSQKNA